MDPLNFTIDGVGLRTNPGALDAYPDEPEKIDPYDHQVELFNLISEEDDFSAVNTAPTGGGKTWSWVVPAVENNMHVLAAFPTNALAEDQRESIEEYKDKYTDDDDELGVLTLTGDSIDRQMAAENSTLGRGDWMEAKIRDGKADYDSLIVLTNPDIFMLLRNGMYKNTYVKNQSGFFDILVFDEFHLADTKGWNSILFLIDELYADTRRGEEYATTSKFIFLSATPKEEVYDRLENGLQELDFYDLADRTSDGRQPWATVQDDDQYRAVMPPVDVELRAGNTFQTASELFAPERFNEVLEFCKEGRTVIMLDGINEVGQMYRALDSTLQQNVERIDGFHNESIKQKLRDFDVLVSNSAVEVGIDFDVDQIIMSGYQQDSFLQRIGRLRNKEEQLNAICYVPRRSLDGFRTKVSDIYNILPKDRPVPRDRFEELVKELFPSPRNPKLFPPLYSAIEAFLHIDQKASRMTSDARNEYMVEARKRLNRHFFEPYDRELDSDTVTELLSKARDPLDKHGQRKPDSQSALADTLSTYRDGGISTLVYDETEDIIKTYDVFHVLRHGQVEFVTEGEFASRVPNKHSATVRQNKRNCLGYCIYHGRRDPEDDDDSGRTARLRATQVLREITELDPEDREPLSITGLEVSVDEPIPGLENFNAALAEESFLVYPLEGSSRRIQQEFHLDDFFFLYDLTDLRGEYSLAMDVNALYLHCHVKARCERQAKQIPFPV